MLSSGYFTWLRFLYDVPAPELARRLGFAPLDVLAGGWVLWSPTHPIPADLIVFRGSTRWSDGILPDGRQVGDLIATQSDARMLASRVAGFFDRGLDHRPAKVGPRLKPTSYPSAVGGGIPQFKLRQSIEWTALLDVPPGAVLTRAMVEHAVAR